TGDRYSAAPLTTGGRTDSKVLEDTVQLLGKSQIPNPKLQIPKTGFGICVLGVGIWVVGFGIFAQAQEQRGQLGTVGALGQEVKRPPARTEPAPRLPDGT